MIRTVIFDYFDVLVNDDYWHEVTAKAEASGAIDRLKRAQFNLNSGISGWEHFCDEIASIMAVTPNYVTERYAAVRVNTELVDYIESIKKQFTIALLSNAESGQLRPQLTTQKLTDLFAYIGISSEYGMLKPNPKLFSSFAKDMSVKPSECVMIDDNADNVQGAIQSGMQAIVFTNVATLKKEMAKII